MRATAADNQQDWVCTLLQPTPTCSATFDAGPSLPEDRHCTMPSQTWQLVTAGLLTCSSSLAALVLVNLSSPTPPMRCKVVARATCRQWQQSEPSTEEELHFPSDPPRARMQRQHAVRVTASLMYFCLQQWCSQP